MIITNENPIINNTNLGAKTFDVEENAVLFWVMSNALYTYKERAVLRELASNGWDAHKTLGKENIPIKIKLPTAMEPELVFQDFGCGMSRQDLENFYFAYFKSTKRASNDSIGGFGVGCKTPFILSQTYSIETIKDGIKNVALAVLDEGIPQSIYVSEEPTTEPSGTIIRIPVSNEVVIRQLHEEAYKLFVKWPVQPIITKGSHGEFNTFKNLYNSFNKDIYLSNDYFNKTNYRSYLNNVTLGMFEYEIPYTLKTKVVHKLIYDNDAAARDIFLGKLSNIHDFLKGASINFNLNIGDIKLSPSRESIEDVAENVEVIAKHFTIAVDQILKDVKDNSTKVLDALNDLCSKPLSSLKEFNEAKDNVYKVYSPELITSVSAYLSSPIDDMEEPNKTKMLNLVKHDYAKNISRFLNKTDSVRYHNIGDILTERYFLDYSLYPHIQSELFFYTAEKGKIFRSCKGYLPRKLLSSSNKGKSDISIFYLVNDMPSLAVRYMNAMNVEHIEINGVKIPYEQILCIPNKEIYALVKKVFKGYFEELDISGIILPKANKKASGPKTKKADIPVFTVYADTTGQLEQRVYNVSEWYDLIFNDDVNFIIFSKDKDKVPAWYWQDLFKTVSKVDKPYVFLGVAKNDEFATQRYTTFFQDKKVTKMHNYNLIPEDLKTLILKCNYGPYIDTVHKFYAAKKTLKIPHFYTVQEESNSTVRATYIKHSKDNVLAIIKDLMGIQEYKKLVRLFIEINGYREEQKESNHLLQSFYDVFAKTYTGIVPNVPEDTFYSVLAPSKAPRESKTFDYKKIPQMHVWGVTLRSCYGEDEGNSLLWLYKTNKEIRDDLRSIYNNLLN